MYNAFPLGNWKQFVKEIPYNLDCIAKDSILGNFNWFMISEIRIPLNFSRKITNRPKNVKLNNNLRT